ADVARAHVDDRAGRYAGRLVERPRVARDVLACLIRILVGLPVVDAEQVEHHRGVRRPERFALGCAEMVGEIVGRCVRDRRTAVPLRLDLRRVLEEADQLDVLRRLERSLADVVVLMQQIESRVAVLTDIADGRLFSSFGRATPSRTTAGPSRPCRRSRRRCPRSPAGGSRPTRRETYRGGSWPEILTTGA